MKESEIDFTQRKLLYGRELVLARKKRVILPIVIILAAACLAFSGFSLVFRGLNKDLFIFGSGSVLFLVAILLIARTGRIEAAGTLALVPIAVLLPIAVFVPLPTDPNVTALFTLAAGGMVAMVLAVLIGTRRYQIVLSGLISAFASLLFYFLVLLPAPPEKADPVWARNNLVAGFILQGVVMAALLYLSSLIDRAFAEIERANSGLEGQVRERTAELLASNEALSSTMRSLEAAQARLVLAERLKLLGELVDGLSHEINTPLGAIVSSAGTAREGMGALADQLLELAPLLGEAERAELVRLFPRLSLEAGRSGSALRQARAEAERVLAERGLDADYEAAEILAQLGLESPGPELLSLLRAAGPGRGSRLLLAVATHRTALALIMESAGRIATVTEALHNYGKTREEEGRHEVDLARNVDLVLPLMQHEMKRGVLVERDYGEGLTVLGHPGRLAQVWLNIIENAGRAMGWKGRLSIAARRIDGEVVVRIANDGPEIEPEVKARIFEPFFSTDASGRSSGLGLSIAKQIVEEHGGVVELVSEGGETAFTVRLPACRDAQGQRNERSEARLEPEDKGFHRPENLEGAGHEVG